MNAHAAVEFCDYHLPNGLQRCKQRGKSLILIRQFVQSEKLREYY
jgi:hypothetical protein